MADAVNIADIKRYALQTIPTSLFTKLVLEEDDMMTLSDYRAAIRVWLTILKQENDEGHLHSSLEGLQKNENELGQARPRKSSHMESAKTIGTR